MALFLDIGPGDVLHIGDGAAVTLEHKSGRRARLRITGEADVKLVKDRPLDQPQAPVVMQKLEATGGRRT